jgi:TM2 domain-containing membrane protein YozV
LFAGAKNPSRETRSARPLRNPGTATLLSLVWVGARQIYNGRIGLGFLLMIIWIAGWFFPIPVLVPAIVWTGGIFHARNDAIKLNLRDGLA